jgi:hypothetical protein
MKDWMHSRDITSKEIMLVRKHIYFDKIVVMT